MAIDFEIFLQIQLNMRLPRYMQIRCKVFQQSRTLTTNTRILKSLSAMARNHACLYSSSNAQTEMASILLCMYGIDEGKCASWLSKYFETPAPDIQQRTRVLHELNN